MLREQTPKQLYVVRGKLYELLTNCIPPEVIFRHLTFELLRKLDDELRHKVWCCWVPCCCLVAMLRAHCCTVHSRAYSACGCPVLSTSRCALCGRWHCLLHSLSTGSSKGRSQFSTSRYTSMLVTLLSCAMS